VCTLGHMFEMDGRGAGASSLLSAINTRLCRLIGYSLDVASACSQMVTSECILASRLDCI
jgi:hypothetical protein